MSTLLLPVIYLGPEGVRVGAREVQSKAILCGFIQDVSRLTHRSESHHLEFQHLSAMPGLTVGTKGID